MLLYVRKIQKKVSSFRGSGALIVTFTPSFFGALYLAMIPLFAFQYFLVERDFFHSTLLSSPTSDYERSLVVSGLANSAEIWCNNSWGSYFSIFHDEEFRSNVSFPLDFCSIENANVRYLDDTFIFNGDLIVSSEKPSAFAEVAFEFAFPFGLPTMNTIDKGHGWHVLATGSEERPTVAHLQYKFEYSRYGVFRSESALLLQGRTNSEESVVAEIFSYNNPIVVEASTLNSMLNYSFAASGDASRISGSYLRMLYLSAVTITTLGYGDITPITDRAKLLVGLQSILGIVVIGLFVSSVATQRGKERD